MFTKIKNKLKNTLKLKKTLNLLKIKRFFTHLLLNRFNGISNQKMEASPRLKGVGDALNLLHDIVLTLKFKDY